MHSTNMVE